MTENKKILFICGSLNQTTMMHQISKHLPDFSCWFTPYYGDKFLQKLSDNGLLDFSILGGQFREKTLKYLEDHNLQTDFGGVKNDYDLIFTCSDLIIPKNIKNKKIILVQEGMTDPENFMYHLVRKFHLPRWLASTSTTGLSNLYTKFCVASEGYKDLFARKGADPVKMVVTGIPNFDNAAQYLDNDFRHKNYVLVATSDMRETFKYENRKKFILNAKKLAGDKQLIFKLHPNENAERATSEINKYAPGAIVYSNHPIEPLIANCDILITRYSSVVYIGLALGKTVYSDFDVDELKKLIPVQNGGKSAENIAEVGREVLFADIVIEKETFKTKRYNFKNKLKRRKNISEKN